MCLSLYIWNHFSFPCDAITSFLSEFLREDGVLRRDEGFYRLVNCGQWARGDLSSHAFWWPRLDFATAFFSHVSFFYQGHRLW